MLFYGMAWSEEGWPDPEVDGEPDWEDALAKARGWVEVPLPSDGPRDQHGRLVSTPEYEAWSASMDAKRKILEALPWDMRPHSCFDSTQWALVVKSTVVRATWGEPKEFDLPAVPEGADAMLLAACKELGLEPTSIGWRLTADYS